MTPRSYLEKSINTFGEWFLFDWRDWGDQKFFPEVYRGVVREKMNCYWKVKPVGCVNKQLFVQASEWTFSVNLIGIILCFYCKPWNGRNSDGEGCGLKIVVMLLKPWIGERKYFVASATNEL